MQGRVLHLRGREWSAQPAQNARWGATAPGLSTGNNGNNAVLGGRPGRAWEAPPLPPPTGSGLKPRPSHLLNVIEGAPPCLPSGTRQTGAPGETELRTSLHSGSRNDLSPTKALGGLHQVQQPVYRSLLTHRSAKGQGRGGGPARLNKMLPRKDRLFLTLNYSYLLVEKPEAERKSEKRTGHTVVAMTQNVPQAPLRARRGHRGTGCRHACQPSTGRRASSGAPLRL